MLSDISNIFDFPKIKKAEPRATFSVLSAALQENYMFEEIAAKIQKYPRIIIHRHKKPDGDAIGSQSGLCRLIADNLPDKEVYTVGDPAGRYAFIAGAECHEIPDEYYRGALSIILDTSSPALISDDRWRLADETVRIDHHLFIEKIADTEVVDTSFESCAGLIAELSRECGWQLSDDAATAIYTGMVTDSGRFRYSSTTAATFERAAYLMNRQIDTGAIYSALYADDFEMIRARASFVMRVRFTAHRVGYIYTDRAELAASGLDSFTASRGMVGVMSDVRGVNIWVNFTETDDGVLCEIRSNKYNINPIAVKYGGGGHAMASGATLPDREHAMALLGDLDAMASNA